MNSSISLYSLEKTEIENFLKQYYGQETSCPDNSEWKNFYENPIELADIIGVFIDNNDKFKINMWVTIDEGFSINITQNNANSIIKYLYERFPR